MRKRKERLLASLFLSFRLVDPHGREVAPNQARPGMRKITVRPFHSRRAVGKTTVPHAALDPSLECFEKWGPNFMGQVERQTRNDQVNARPIAPLHQLIELVSAGMHDFHGKAKALFEAIDVRLLQLNGQKFRVVLRAPHDVLSKYPCTRTELNNVFNLVPRNALHHGAAGYLRAGHHAGVSKRRLQKIQKELLG